MALSLDGTTGVSASGNVTGGNVLTGGLISATGNITGSYILGNGSQLSGIDATSIQSGTSNVKVVSSGGNVTVGVAGTSNVVVVDAFGTYITGNLSVSGNATLSGNILGDRVQNGTTSIDIQVASGNANISVGGTSNVAVFATTGEYVTGLISANGTVTGGNLATGGIASATGNITGGNVLTGGVISATGNVTGNYILGNGACLSGVITSVANINNGTSNVTVVSSGGNVTVGIGGTSNVAVFATTGEYVTGLISATGNITGGNVLTGGLISATGNITGGNITVYGVGGDLTGANVVSATTLSATANVKGGNVTTGGVISATGNVTGSYFLGNGACLSGVITSVANINNGTSNVTVVSSGGNITVGVGGTSNVAVFATTGEYVTGLISATGNITGGNILGGANVNATTHTGTTVSVTGNVTGGNVIGGNVLTGGTASATGNIDGGNLRTSGLISASGNVLAGNLIIAGNGGDLTGANVISATTLSSTGNVQGGNLRTGGLISATGNVTGGNVTTAGVLTINSGNAVTAIVNGGSNAVGNIGSATVYFNRIFAQATTALYADLAEMYTADAQYPASTVVVFGGNQEITISTVSHDSRVAGVVSTNPAHIMNSGITGNCSIAVALTGRVPCQVVGPISKGDQVVSSPIAGVAERLDISQYQPGVVIGKSLEDHSGLGVGTIEIVVGRV